MHKCTSGQMKFKETKTGSKLLYKTNIILTMNNKISCHMYILTCILV